jgi:hypothetical protein
MNATAILAALVGLARLAPNEAPALQGISEPAMLAMWGTALFVLAIATRHAIRAGRTIGLKATPDQFQRTQNHDTQVSYTRKAPERIGVAMSAVPVAARFSNTYVQASVISVTTTPGFEHMVTESFTEPHLSFSASELTNTAHSAFLSALPATQRSAITVTPAAIRE